MSTLTEDKVSLTGKIPSSSPSKVRISSDGDEGGLGTKNIFMGCSRSELADEFESLEMTNRPNREKQAHKVGS